MRSPTFARRPHTPSPSQGQKALIEELGGPKAVADDVSRRLAIDPPLSSQAVSNWKKRGIPYNYRGVLCRAAGERGIGVPPDFLVGEAMAPPPPAPAEDETPGFLQESA